MLVGGRVGEHADDRLSGARARSPRSAAGETRLVGLECEQQRHEVALGAAGRGDVEQRRASSCPRPFATRRRRRASRSRSVRPCPRTSAVRRCSPAGCRRSSWRAQLGGESRRATRPHASGQKLFQPSNSTSTGSPRAAALLVPGRRRRVAAQLEPVEAVARQRQQVRQLADRRKRRAPEQLDRHACP